jgi:hypothetical protein
MVGLAPAEGDPVVKKLLINRNIQLVNDRIQVNNMFEVAKQAQFFRNMQQREQSRQIAGQKKY